MVLSVIPVILEHSILKNFFACLKIVSKEKSKEKNTLSFSVANGVTFKLLNILVFAFKHKLSKRNSHWSGHWTSAMLLILI